MPCELCGRKLIDEKPGYTYICETCRRSKPPAEIAVEIFKKRGGVFCNDEGKKEEKRKKKKTLKKRRIRDAKEDEALMRL